VKAGFFVAGTDTGVGKTTFAAALLRRLAALGLRVAGMKPVAAGVAGGRNEDLEALLAASSPGLDRKLACPYLFEPPIAPHIAAAEAGARIDTAVIERAFHNLSKSFECIVVEGVGGLRVPLNEREDAADMARRLGLPVILVVGVRLGCLSHALLTQEAIRNRGMLLAGWVASRIDPHMARAGESIGALGERLEAPLIAEMPYGAAMEFPVRLEPLWPGRGSP
jgi:dethiobiotin synthetase